MNYFCEFGYKCSDVLKLHFSKILNFYIKVFLIFVLMSPAKNEWIEITQNSQKNHQISPSDAMKQISSAHSRFEKTLSPRSSTSNRELFRKASVQKADIRKFKTYPAHIERLENIKSNFHKNESFSNKSNKSETTTETTIATTLRNVETTKLIVSSTSPDTISERKMAENVVITTEKTYIPTTEITFESKIEAENQEEYDEYIDDEDVEDNQENNYRNASFIPYLKTIQNTLIKNAHKTINSKIRLLKQLRDNLLINIEERMSVLWMPNHTSREARGHKDDDHEMDFPSNEGALMTIGFLTFAVFLIKLVLKLIMALKEKTNNGSSNNMMSGMTMMTSYIGRKKRDLFDEDAIRILNLIDEYSLK